MPSPQPERLNRSPASWSRLVNGLISAPDERVSRERATTWVALLTGVTFIVAGLVKFVFHHWELHAFRSFGLPWPSALEISAGVLETVGGILLVLRRAVLPAAIVLGVTMIVAIISSGIGHGDVIPSLTLAPALLLATLFLLVRGLGLGGTGRA
jgi:putative oxidoreductase